MTELNQYQTDADVKWCPGCGNFGILKAMKQAFAAMDIPPEKLVLISGIGQAANTPHYIRCNMFHSLHGRALAIATGTKTANHSLNVVVNSGDGDCYGEGGNHFINAVRRNIDITLLVHDNKVYGLTKGQASPTADMHFVTKAQPFGVMLEPFNPLAAALVLKAGFAARGFAGDSDHLSALIQAAMNHKGFSLIDILQPCVSFNHVNTFSYYADRVYDLNSAGHDTSNFKLALEKALDTSDRIPIGIFYKQDKPSFTDRFKALKETPLIDQAFNPETVKEMIRNM